MRYSFFLIPAVMIVRVSRWLYTKGYLPLKTCLIVFLWRIKCGRNVSFYGKVILRAYERGAIEIGDDVMFMSRPSQNLVGLTNPTIICAAKGAKISIGSHTGLSSPVINAAKSIVIGSYVNIGGNVRVFDHDFHPLKWNERRPPQRGDSVRVAPVIIEDDCFIGTNAIILKGTHLGARSIVAAGSVVFGLDVPSDSMVKGNPAKVIARV